jgi:hypothetical protein
VKKIDNAAETTLITDFCKINKKFFHYFPNSL